MYSKHTSLRTFKTYRKAPRALAIFAKFGSAPPNAVDPLITEKKTVKTAPRSKSGYQRIRREANLKINLLKIN